jgi:hypothetical protein
MQWRKHKSLEPRPVYWEISMIPWQFESNEIRLHTPCSEGDSRICEQHNQPDQTTQNVWKLTVIPHKIPKLVYSVKPQRVGWLTTNRHKRNASNGARGKKEARKVMQRTAYISKATNQCSEQYEPHWHFDSASTHKQENCLVFTELLETNELGQRSRYNDWMGWTIEGSELESR